MKIKLSKSQIKLLNRIFQAEKNINYTIDKNFININDNFQQNLEIIINIVSNYLMKFGFDNKGEPNKLGQELESLNDIFIELHNQF